MHVHICIRMCIYICIRMHIRIYIRMHVCIFRCIRIFSCMCTWMHRDHYARYMTAAWLIHVRCGVAPLVYHNDHTNAYWMCYRIWWLPRKFTVPIPVHVSQYGVTTAPSNVKLRWLHNDNHMTTTWLFHMCFMRVLRQCMSYTRMFCEDKLWREGMECYIVILCLSGMRWSSTHNNATTTTNNRATTNMHTNTNVNTYTTTPYTYTYIYTYN